MLKEDETARSHMKDHTQLREGISFHHAARAERRESLAHDDSQNKEEVEEDIKH